MRPSDPTRSAMPRFGIAVRWVHRSTAWLVGVLALTGAALYVPSLALQIGRRPLVEAVHIVAGLLLPLPTALGVVLSRELRADVRALDRMTATDRVWLRRRDRRTARLPIGKFNAGQKLAAAAMAGAGGVLLGTGLLLIGPRFVDLPDAVRTGATITHDLFTGGLLALLAGHAWLAYRHPEARAAMRTGQVDRDYAEREHPAWAQLL